MNNPVTRYLKAQVIKKDGVAIGAVELLHPDDGRRWGSYENLLFQSLDGRVVWKAELPDPGATDCYVDFQWDEKEGLSANSWSCYWVKINMMTGKITEREFGK